MFHKIENPELAIALAKEMDEAIKIYYTATWEDKIIYSRAIEKVYNQMTKVGALDCLYIDTISFMTLLSKHANNDIMQLSQITKLTDCLEMIEIRCENLIAILTKYPL